MESEKGIPPEKGGLPVTTADVSHPPEEVQASFVRRVGALTISIIGFSLAVLIACVGFLSWLWYSNIDSLTWHKIMVNGWATRAVSLTSTALRWAVATQGGLGLAMLAALSLERFEVPLANVASVSLMSVNGGSLVSTLRDVCLPLIRFGTRGAVFRSVFPIVVLLVTATLLQFTSTALLSDLHVTPIPGFPENANVSIDWNWDGTVFNYIPPASSEVVWNGNTPGFWPTFAELSGPAEEPAGVVDTGMNIRAFLPYSAAEARQNLYTYDGKAYLIDTRATCQKPIFTDAIMYTDSPEGIWGITDQPVFSGNVAPSTNTPRLNASDGPVAFDCPYSRANRGKFSICELHNVRVRYPAGNPKDPYAGTLISEFRHYPPGPLQDASGAAYLIIAVDNDNVQYSNGEWAVLPIIVPGDGENPKDTDTHNVTATLCFTSLDAVRRDVHIYSSSNRTEPQISWNQTTESFNWTSVRDQLLSGSKNPLSPEERGILNLAPAPEGETWVADTSLEPGYDGPFSNIISGGIYQRVRPYIQDNLHLQRPSGYPYGNYSVTLDEWAYGWIIQYGGWPQALAKRWIVNIFETMLLGGNGTVADALHLVLFSLAAAMYYDQLPQYDVSTTPNTVPFVQALHPGGPLGTTRTTLPIGFTVVMVVLGLHLLAFFIICWTFATQSKYARLGDTWMAIAHVADATMTENILLKARHVRGTRNEATGESDQRVNVGLAVVDEQVQLTTNTNK
ncbi:hypothetical protein AA313_de0206455 [Arthrobotrys entomopaga]|nr:hypothetical protein AA313_de0206455 [Arthrobotrys entomopaga]